MKTYHALLHGRNLHRDPTNELALSSGSAPLMMSSQVSARRMAKVRRGASAGTISAERMLAGLREQPSLFASEQTIQGQARAPALRIRALRRYAHLRTRGFTLIEVLVVIAIISILAGIVTLNLGNKTTDAKVAAAQTQLRSLKAAVNMYRNDNGAPPTLAQGLNALITKPTIAPVPANYPTEGYLDTRVLPKDPWKQDFIYLVPGRRGEAFEIITYGRDGQPGGEGYDADLSSSDL